MGSQESLAASATSEIYTALKRDLIGGRFRAGEKLAINALKQHYRIGLSPLREALNRLAAYGLLEQENQRGFRVPALSRDELDDIIALRQRFEGEALTQALARGDADWEARLIGAGHRLKRADETATDLEQWEQAHLQFHRCLLEQCGSPWLLRFIEQLHDQFDRYRRMAPANPAIRETLDSQHAELVTLALAGHSRAACDLLQAHIRLSGEVALGACQIDERGQS
ncbi:GntR family transcriptional regulator [Salinicola avicenniae]|uniref:GntR family transcriptional regulator n=1 Tax=Salinicola avicenniae TaxID=2916836 RepID=UPI002073B89F|nr:MULTISPECIES: FCD domain-containing protein [unclassified Salinicola]